MSNTVAKFEPVSVLPSLPAADYYGTLDEIERVARACAQSGFWRDITDVSQAVVKMLAGREMGIAPLAAISGIHVIEGKPTAGANLIAANVKRSGRYDYRVVERTDKRCELAWFDGGQQVGTSAFSMDDATRADLAGKANWRKFPRAMLFARALTEGVRVYCPDAAGGVVYTVEELRPDLAVTESGEPVVAPETAPAPAPAPAAVPAAAPATAAVPRPHKPLISEAQRKRLWAIWSKRAEALQLGPGAKEQGLRDILAAVGIENTRDIPRDGYEAIVTACEKWLPPIADDAQWGELEPAPTQDSDEWGQPR